MSPKNSLVIASAIVLILAACGGDDSGDGDGVTTQAPDVVNDDGGAAPTSTTAAPATTEPAETGGADTPAVTEMGSFTVDGTEFAVTFLNRCIPFSGPDSEDIDLQPIAQGQGAGLNLYGTADSVEVSVQGTTVEEIGGTNAFAADPFGDDGEIRASSIEGDRWTGEATLADAYGSESTVEVTWDVMIPDEVRDCSL